jgi:hypothetical protein
VQDGKEANSGTEIIIHLLILRFSGAITRCPPIGYEKCMYLLNQQGILYYNRGKCEESPA